MLEPFIILVKQLEKLWRWLTGPIEDPFLEEESKTLEEVGALPPAHPFNDSSEIEEDLEKKKPD